MPLLIIFLMILRHAADYAMLTLMLMMLFDAIDADALIEYAAHVDVFRENKNNNRPGMNNMDNIIIMTIE